MKIRKVKIIEVKDVASARSDIKVSLLVSCFSIKGPNSIEYSCELSLNVIYFLDGKSENRLFQGGDWKVLSLVEIPDLILTSMKAK